MTAKPDEKAPQGDTKEDKSAKPVDSLHLKLLTDASQETKTAGAPTAPASTKTAEAAHVGMPSRANETKGKPALTDAEMNDILYKGLTSAKDLLTTTKEDLLRSKDNQLVDEAACRALKVDGKEDTNGVCKARPEPTATSGKVNNTGSILDQISMQGLKHGNLEQKSEGPVDVTNTDIKDANTAQASFDWAVSTWQKYGVTDQTKMDGIPGLERLPNGGYIRRDAHGHEVFRKEGDIATVTAPDGRHYKYNNKTHETQAFDENGKEIMRKHADGSIDFVHPDGSFVRKIGQFIETHGKDGKLGCVIELKDGKIQEIDLRDYIKIKRERLGLFDGKGSAPAPSVFSALDKALAAQKQGVTVATDATITTDQNGQTMIRSVDGKGSYIFVDKDTAIFRDAQGHMEIIKRDGRKTDVPPDKVSELTKKYGPAMQTMMEAAAGIQRVLTARGLVTVVNNGQGDTTVTGPDGAKVHQTAIGLTATDAAGTTVEVAPNGTGAIKAPDGQDIQIAGGHLRYQGLDLSPDGNVRDTKNGTQIDNRGIQLADGTRFDNESGHIRFADGVELGRNGEVVDSGSGSGSGKTSAVAQAEASSRAAEASSMASRAESIASSVAAKAASGRLTAGDVAMLQAALGGLERSLQMLDNETDMTSLVRLMMGKGTVEGALAQATAEPTKAA